MLVHTIIFHQNKAAISAWDIDTDITPRGTTSVDTRDINWECNALIQLDAIDSKRLPQNRVIEYVPQPGDYDFVGPLQG